MFLYLGGDTVVWLSDLVAIVDIRHVFGPHASKDNEAAVARAEREGRLVRVTTDPPKSVVIARDACYLSPISSLGLERRARGPLADELLRDGTGKLPPTAGEEDFVG